VELVFAVPRPTTIVTAGWLPTAAGLPRFVNVVPLLWAACGSSAAVTLGIRADLALAAAGVFLAVDTVRPEAPGRRAGRRRAQADGLQARRALPYPLFVHQPRRGL